MTKRGKTRASSSTPRTGFNRLFEPTEATPRSRAASTDGGARPTTSPGLTGPLPPPDKTSRGEGTDATAPPGECLRLPPAMGPCTAPLSIPPATPSSSKSRPVTPPEPPACDQSSPQTAQTTATSPCSPRAHNGSNVESPSLAQQAAVSAGSLTGLLPASSSVTGPSAILVEPQSAWPSLPPMQAAPLASLPHTAGSPAAQAAPPRAHSLEPDSDTHCTSVQPPGTQDTTDLPSLHAASACYQQYTVGRGSLLQRASSPQWTPSTPEGPSHYGRHQVAPLPQRMPQATRHLSTASPPFVADWTVPPSASPSSVSGGSWHSDGSLPHQSMPVTIMPVVGPRGAAHPDLETLIRALPTKADLEQMFPSKSDFETFTQRIESAYAQDIAELRQDLSSQTVRLDSVTSQHDAIVSRLTSLEQEQSLLRSQNTSLHLLLDDQENRGRRNNIRIKGLPEATSNADLPATVSAIFNTYLGRDVKTAVEIDRVHRTPTFGNPDASRPRDVLCRLHYFSVKEDVMRRAWQRGPLDFDGARIHLYPDLSRRTLLMRRELKPLLEAIREIGASYRWGFPLHLIIKHQDRSFVLRTPAELPDLYAFLNIAPVMVPDWLSIPPSGDISTSRPPAENRARRRTRPAPRGARRTSPRPSNAEP